MPIHSFRRVEIHNSFLRVYVDWSRNLSFRIFVKIPDIFNFSGTTKNTNLLERNNSEERIKFDHSRLLVFEKIKFENLSTILLPLGMMFWTLVQKFHNFIITIDTCLVI